MYKNVDITCSAHHVFLESPSSASLKVENLENQTIFKSGLNVVLLFQKLCTVNTSLYLHMVKPK